MGNKGAFIKFKAPELKPDIKTFTAVVRAYIAGILCSSLRWSGAVWLVLILQIFFFVSSCGGSHIPVWKRWHMPATCLAYWAEFIHIPFTWWFFNRRFLHEKVWYSCCAKGWAPKTKSLERCSHLWLQCKSKSGSRAKSYESMIHTIRFFTAGFFSPMASCTHGQACKRTKYSWSRDLLTIPLVHVILSWEDV